MNAKKAGAALLAALLAAGGTGCFSLETSTTVHPEEEHVLVSNYGWYLFGFIPIVCGNADGESSFPFALFRNDVTMDKIQRAFMDYAEKQGKTDVYELSYSNDDTVLFEIPGTQFPVPIPYIVTYREIILSGSIRPPAAGPEGQPPAASPAPGAKPALEATR